jgi:hypothetical protein
MFWLPHSRQNTALLARFSARRCPLHRTWSMTTHNKEPWNQRQIGTGCLGASYTYTHGSFAAATSINQGDFDRIRDLCPEPAVCPACRALRPMAVQSRHGGAGEVWLGFGTLSGILSHFSGSSLGRLLFNQFRATG